MCGSRWSILLQKKDKKGEWRGPGKVISRDGKAVVVKHGGNVRKVRWVHISRLRGTEREEEKEGEIEEGEEIEDGETDEEWEGVVMKSDFPDRREEMEEVMMVR